MQLHVVVRITLRRRIAEHRYPSVVLRDHHRVSVVREDQTVEPHRLVLRSSVLGVGAKLDRARVDPRLKGFVCGPEILAADVLCLVDNQELATGRPVVMGAIGSKKTRLQEKDRDPDKIIGISVYLLSM